MTIDLDTPYPLTDAQVEQFRRDGFIKLEDVFDAAVLRHYGEEITRLHLASQRLLEGDQTVADIAYALGFATLRTSATSSTGGSA